MPFGIESSLSDIVKGTSLVSFVRGSTVVTLDASLTETHKMESVPTEFEVEDGQTISDHIILKPVSLSMQCIISDSPLNLLTSAISVVTTAISHRLPSVGVLGKAAGGLALAGALDLDFIQRSKTGYQNLLKLRNAGLPFDVQTSLSLYKNMWFKTISIPRDAKTAKALIFDVELIQLLIVPSQTVNYTTLANAAVSAAEGDKGSQAPISDELKGDTANGIATGRNFSGN